MALGCLELMWEKCYQNGDPYLGDEIDIEAACQWNGEPGKLTRAFLDSGGEGNSGFIEPAAGHPGYQCHDLFDHAPRYVGTRLQRELARVEKGQTLSQIRASVGRKGGMASKRAANERSLADKTQASEQQIAHTPAPAPIKDVPPLAPKGAGKGKAPKYERDCAPENEPSIRKVYDSWPKEHPSTHEPAKKGAFAPAARAFQKIIDSGEATARELKSCGLLYAKTETFPERIRQRVFEAWDHRDHAIMHTATFYGPEKRPYRQLLPLAREVLAERDAQTAPVTV